MTKQPLRDIPEQDFRWPITEEHFPELKKCLRERGSLVLRGVINPEKVDLYRDLVEKTRAIHLERCAEQGFDVDHAAREWGGAGGWAGVAWSLKMGQITPQLLADCFPGSSILHLVDG